MPIPHKLHNKIQTTLDNMYKQAVKIPYTTSSISTRITLGYDSVLQRTNQLALGYYWRIIHIKNQHRIKKLFINDFIKAKYTISNYHTNYTNYLTQYEQFTYHTQWYIYILQQHDLSEYIDYDYIYHTTKQQWKKLIQQRTQIQQQYYDNQTIQQTNNTLLKYKWNMYYYIHNKTGPISLLRSIFHEQHKSIPQYTINIYTNSTHYNWKEKQIDGSYQYIYPKCILCNQTWNDDNTQPIQHLLTNCSKIHQNILNTNEYLLAVLNRYQYRTDYKIWNIKNIIRLAEIVQNQMMLDTN
jgi:hypothetical protein